MKKRRQRQEKDNLERWLLTYSDLITLLMIFFIVMFAMSELDNKKFQAISQALSKALGGTSGAVLNGPGPSVVPGAIQNPDDLKKDQQKENIQLVKLKQEINEYTKNNGLEGRVVATIEERGLVVSFYDPVLFPRGSAELMPNAREIISKVGKILSQTGNYLRVEGHTDNLPINNFKFPSNWELSTARALTVVKVMINDLGFPPRRLAAMGYGEYRPRAPNDSELNRQSNRRVEIVVLRSKYEQSEPPSNVRAGTPPN